MRVFRFPIVLRSTAIRAREEAAASAARISRVATADNLNHQHEKVVAAKDAEIAELKLRHNKQAEEITALLRANMAVSKVLGVVTQRAPVRFLVEDLRSPGPEIHFVEEEHARKPSLRVVAVYKHRNPHGDRHDPVPEKSELIVDSKGNAGPSLT